MEGYPTVFSCLQNVYNTCTILKIQNKFRFEAQWGNLENLLVLILSCLLST